MTIDIFKKGIKRLQEAFPRRSIIPGFYWNSLKEIPDNVFIKVVLAITKEPVNLQPSRDLLEAIKSGASHITRLQAGPTELADDKKKFEKWKAERAETIPEGWTKLKEKLKGSSCQNQAS